METIASRARLERARSGATSEEKGSFALRDRRAFDALSLTQSWSLEPAGRHELHWGWELQRYDARFDYANDLRPAFVIAAPFSPPRPSARRADGSLTAATSAPGGATAST